MNINKKRIVIRFLVSPFILGMLLITYTYHCLIRFKDFLAYGGEFINYEYDESAKIQDIYEILKKTK